MYKEADKTAMPLLQTLKHGINAGLECFCAYVESVYIQHMPEASDHVGNNDEGTCTTEFQPLKKGILHQRPRPRPTCSAELFSYASEDPSTPYRHPR